MMTTAELTALLQDAIYDHDELNEAGAETRTFEEVGVLTMNDGLELRLNDGSRFQITIVQSR